MSTDLDAAAAELDAHNQAHLLTFRGDLDDHAQKTLAAQISAIDFDQLDRLIERYVTSDDSAAIPDDLAPASVYPMPPTEAYDAAAYREKGEAIIRAGQVAAFTVAGGQGTRLGWNGPKGTYPASVVTGKPLFRLFAEQIIAAERTYGVTIPWYIMTSPLNDAATRSFFLDNNCFGLNRTNIFMFPQGTMPSLDKDTGRILLASKHELALNPDGHGGSIKALVASGATEDMAARGVEHISYFQVDNPNVHIIDPLFIGLHAHAPDSSGQMSSKMVRKTDPEEKVGVFCQSGGKTMVVEYSDLPPKLAQQRDDHDSLAFDAGSIAIHLISRAFVEQLCAGDDGFALPWHRAEKKVPHLDLDSGETITPQESNAVKLETFVFDAIPLADKSIVLETGRTEEFAPIKNAKGADSPATSHQLQSDRAANWLEQHGVDVPRDSDGHARAKIEISPLTAQEPGDLAGVDLPESIDDGAEVIL